MLEAPTTRTTNQVISKSELAGILCISSTTLADLLNNKYFNDLKNFGYSENQKLLLPCQANWLFKKLDISNDE